MKLKKLIQESVWGKREFGDALPTMDDYKKEYELGKVYTDKDKPPFKIQEGDIEKKVDTKEVVKRMLKNFKGQYTWVGKAWAKELLGKYKKGISQTDFIIDAENLKNTFDGHTGGDDIFKGLNEGKLNEANESTWTIVYKGLVAGFRKSKDKRLEVVARAVSFLIKTEFGVGAKNDFIKAFKKSL